MENNQVVLFIFTHTAIQSREAVHFLLLFGDHSGFFTLEKGDKVQMVYTVPGPSLCKCCAIRPMPSMSWSLWGSTFHSRRFDSHVFYSMSLPKSPKGGLKLPFLSYWETIVASPMVLPLLYGQMLPPPQGL